MNAAAAFEPPPRALARRLRTLQIGVALQNFMLWVAVEKLFMTEIGFTAVSIGVMAAAYSVVVPLLEVPSGILADRWSRNWLMVLASIALGLSSLVGGLSTNVASYVVAAMILGVYFALNSGTVDSVVYDTVLEETGSSTAYESWIGRVRIVESAALVASALLGGLLAGWVSPRFTYYASVPFAVLSVGAFLLFREPRLHRRSEPTSLRQHLSTMFAVMTRQRRVRRVMLLAAVAGLLSQAVFEFGPLWLVAGESPAALYGPYWATLVASLGVGGYLTSRLRLDRARNLAVLAAVLAAVPVTLALTHALVAIVLAQALLAVLIAIVGIHAGLLLHDAVASHVRAGVSSGVGTLSWIVFVPFSLLLGWLVRIHGVAWAGWVFTGVAALLAGLLVVAARPGAAAVDASQPDVADLDDLPAGHYPPAPSEVACRELVGLVTDYLDGVLPPQWRHGLEEHLAQCDGCTEYLSQIRAIIDAVERLAADERSSIT
jgi:predicted MFS family arabinose efflux permease